MDIDEARKACTPQERAFAEAYVQSYNATDAAIKAGFDGTREGAANKGSKLKRRETVRAYIDALTAEAAADAGISRNGLVARLARIVERCTSEETRIEHYGEGKECERPVYDAKSAIKAIEAIAHLLGYDTQEADAVDSIAIGFGAEIGDDGD